MPSLTLLLRMAISCAAVVVADSSQTLANVCTSKYAAAALPDPPLGITFDSSSVTATATTNYNVTGSYMYPDATFDFCNVTFSYSHNGLGDQVYVTFWLPSPANFRNRYLSTGGGGYAINSGAQSLAGGIPYGAVSGETDGGFGSFSTSFDDVFLLANGTINWHLTYMFGYQAHHELTLIGKAFTRKFFKMAAKTKLYAYYQACSEGGREGFSQVQRYGGLWDGAIIGAPAMRYSFQQAQHLYSNLVEYTMNYFPPPCEFELIVNKTIAYCDPLDGKTDGVVARTDLCKLHFNLDTLVGEHYSCAATTGSSMGGMGGGPPGTSSTNVTGSVSASGITGATSSGTTASSTSSSTSTASRMTRKQKRQMGGGSSSEPAQNGTVTAQGVAVAKEILKGLQDLQGQQVYLSYQPSADFDDAETQYNSETGKWELSITSLGGEWIGKFLNLYNVTNIDNFDGWTYDTLKNYMIQGLNMYSDVLQTDWPDLTPYHSGGGKILHYHGESDFSVPTASSVRYWESVRSIMYPNMTTNASTAALNDWYRLYLVPGAGHCAPNSEQENGPFPQTNLAVMINWVEKGVIPTTLNATILQGDHQGQNQQICSWPLRPLWTQNGTKMECVFDQSSINTWLYDFNGVPLPVY